MTLGGRRSPRPGRTSLENPSPFPSPLPARTSPVSFSRRPWMSSFSFCSFIRHSALCTSRLRSLSGPGEWRLASNSNTLSSFRLLEQVDSHRTRASILQVCNTSHVAGGPLPPGGASHKATVTRAKQEGCGVGWPHPRGTAFGCGLIKRI